MGVLGRPVERADLGRDHPGAASGWDMSRCGSCSPEVAVPVADQLTRGAFLGAWRLMAIDGFEWDAPDTSENAAAFGFPGKRQGWTAGVPEGPGGHGQRVRLSCGGGRRDRRGGWQGRRRAVAGPQALPAAGGDWLLIADRNFYNWADWCAAADSGAALLWRVRSDLTLPVLELLPDGSYRSVLVNPKITR